MTLLTAEKMRTGLTKLDEKLNTPVRLIVGGGGAMLLAHNFPLATSDIDAVPKGLSVEELQPMIEAVAREQGLPLDWLNPWFSSFTHVLPHDFELRLVNVFAGQKLRADALGREDLLIMKCFAHRQKDIAHARALIRDGADVDFVYERIDELLKKRIPSAKAAQEFLDEILDLEGR
jgi:hypothetical protein